MENTKSAAQNARQTSKNQKIRTLFRHLFLIFLCAPGISWAIPFEGHEILISAASHYGVDAGVRAYKKGGNVIDAAVATELALAVSTPYYASLGGGGFAVIHFGKETLALDFREVAPGATNEKYYLKKGKDASTEGGTAVAVPGVVAGLWAMHKKWGRLPWRTLFEDALELSQKGIQVSGEWVSKTDDESDRFNASAKQILMNGSKPFSAGDNQRQIQLFEALKIIQTKGDRGFYDGPVAQDISSTVKSAGGEISLKDLKDYRVRWLEPFHISFNGFDVYTMPPPSSAGPVMSAALALTEKLQLATKKPLSVEELHLLGEILSRAFRGRSLLGDPDFVKNPIAKLTSPSYIAELAKSISAKASAIPPLDDKNFKESPETTHFSVMDKDGNSVSFTTTLNGNYGSGLYSQKFGIALNNEMDDFTTRPGEPNQFGLIQGRNNSIEPGKRPLSSMSPTIIQKQGKTVLVLGAPGGPRIISAVFQVLYRALVNGFDIDKSIQMPRVHHQFLPNKLVVEDRLPPDTDDSLKKLGHEIEIENVAKVFGIKKTESGLSAAFDSRGEGSAGGY